MIADPDGMSDKNEAIISHEDAMTHIPPRHMAKAMERLLGGCSAACEQSKGAVQGTGHFHGVMALAPSAGKVISAYRNFTKGGKVALNEAQRRFMDELYDRGYLLGRFEGQTGHGSATGTLSASTTLRTSTLTPHH